MPPSGICSRARARTHASVFASAYLCMHMHTRRARSVGEFAGHRWTSPLNNTRFRRTAPFADDSFTSSSRVCRREFLRTFPPHVAAAFFKGSEFYPWWCHVELVSFNSARGVGTEGGGRGIKRILRDLPAPFLHAPYIWLHRLCLDD